MADQLPKKNPGGRKATREPFTLGPEFPAWNMFPVNPNVEKMTKVEKLKAERTPLKFMIELHHPVTGERILQPCPIFPTNLLVLREFLRQHGVDLYPTPAYQAACAKGTSDPAGLKEPEDQISNDDEDEARATNSIRPKNPIEENGAAGPQPLSWGMVQSHTLPQDLVCAQECGTQTDAGPPRKQ